MTPGEGDRLRRAVEASGTVTEFLESLVGEPVVARKLCHRCVPATAGNPLGLPAGEMVVRRAVVLEGRTGASALVYAESTLACGRLPRAVCRRLADGAEPIGRVLLDEGLALGREPLAGVPRARAGLGWELAAGLGASPLVRSYRIVVDRTPVVAVDEWFLPAAADRLGSAGPPGRRPGPSPGAGRPPAPSSAPPRPRPPSR